MVLYSLLKIACAVSILSSFAQSNSSPGKAENLSANEATENLTECKCENGKCVQQAGKAVCICHPEYGKFSETICKACNCGKGANCTFTGFWSTRTCICPSGYRENNGKCEDDPEASTLAFRETTTIYLPSTTVNPECKCENGTCVQQSGKAVCICHPEYGKFTEGVCKACNCGKGANCTFTGFWSTRICICPSGYRETNGKCEYYPGTTTPAFSSTITMPSTTTANPDDCYPNPCLNGGTCGLNAGRFRCYCKDQFAGEKCEINLCSFIECKNGGLCGIVNNRPRCFCSLPFIGEFCEKEILTFSARYPSKAITEAFVNTTAASYEPHTSTVIHKTHSVFTSQSKQFTKTNFVGTTYAPLTTSPRKTTTVVRTPLASWTTTEFPTTNPCSWTNCKNGGVCKVEKYRTRCYCLTPYTGDYCEIGPCTSDPCMNGGSCRVEQDTFRCECPMPYSGKFCEKDPCNRDPCHNGGTCILSGYTSKCICKEAFKGDRCETDLCAENPCQNGGTCTFSGSTPKCICKQGFAGDSCEKDLCAENPCQNGGTCFFSGFTSKCICKDGFAGDRCEAGVCAENPCQNGGTCFFSGSTSKCICKDGFTGDRCETAGDNFKYILIMAGLVILVMVFTILIVRLLLNSLSCCALKKQEYA